MTDRELAQVVARAARSGATQLDLSYCELATLPREIGKLDQLVSLDLCGNDLIALPPEIGQLRFLTRLDLRHNQLLSLPAEIGLLTGLRSLDLRDNRLSTLPPEMEMMVNLSCLDIRQNRLQVFPQVILRLFGLEELQLWHNPLLTLPRDIEQLIRLRLLNLGGNTMPEIPEGVWRLTGLEHLIVDHTHLTALPRDVRYLQNLKYVELHDNRLSGLPAEIGELQRLLALVLHHNAITHLPPAIGSLTRLRRLDVHHNQLVSVPQEISKLVDLDLLDLTENPLSVPPEILIKTNDPTAIMTYYVNHLDGPKRPLNEAKMVLVGQGGVGKTSLVRRLMQNTFDAMQPQTNGIEIQRWRVKVNDTDLQLNVWDFGGQEIMHATHQFFLTKRTLYVLVLDCRLNEEENRLEYWLKIIQSFGGDSPVILVANKSDQQPMDLDERGLRAKYPQICSIIETSCANRHGIDRLQARIMREVTRMPHVRDALLTSWFDVKRDLEELDRDYIPYEQYVDMCLLRGIRDERSQRTLIGFLHDLGIVINFQDDPRLEDTNILNPQWVTQGVYRILCDQELQSKRGRLERAALSRVLDPHVYPRHKHQFILDIMQKFELCFPFHESGGRVFLVPDLLSKEAPATGDWHGALAFQYHYNVLPSSVISRFIVRMHSYIHEDIRWRNGVVVADACNVALVQADREERRVVIRVRGPETTRRALLSIIRFHFDMIHSSIPGIRVEEKVPLPDHPEVVVDYQYLVDLEAMGERRFVPPGLRQRVDVRSLLEGVDLAAGQREPARLRRMLSERFNTEELRGLCQDLGVDWDVLDATDKAGKARELIAYLERRDCLGDLVRVGRQLRPDVGWGPIPLAWT